MKSDACRLRAQEVARRLKEHGADAMIACRGDDVPEGKLTSMPLVSRH